MKYLEQKSQEGSLPTIVVLGLCVSIFLIDPIVNELHLLPHVFSWLPEMFSAVAAVVVMVLLSRSNRLMIRPIYIALFLFFFAITIAGWLINEVHGWTVVAGLRSYFKYVPLFLLPVAANFSDNGLRKQLRWIAAILILQFPMVILQKWFLHYPPDHITGTAMISSTLSFLLISGIGLVLALYMKEQLSLGIALTLGLIFFFPTTINETKGTLVMLPICMATVFLLSRKNAKRKISWVVAFGSIATLMSIFFLMYSLTLPTRQVGNDSSEPGGLVAFIADPANGFWNYLFSGDASLVDAEAILRENPSKVLGTKSDPGIVDGRMRRLDSTILPYYILRERPTRLAIGLGAANTSEFSIGSANGRYGHIWSYISVPVSATIISLELGYLGLATFLLFVLLVFQDSIRLSRTSGWDSAIGCWWAGIALMFLFAMIYKDFITFNTTGFLFWYFSGLVAARSFIAQFGERIKPNSREEPTTTILASQPAHAST